ncbi:hypothetical protein NW755_010623 [Fusarium falciforme]|uniref:ShKT domain-containing protein n=1 Tax=Fusarium falciforme TaxID=195108 RepID=A0A9W8QZ80_9HYPO|nr:hypothetical protein NW755_010623 [Fusarium falciforme]KAJ4243139.1 hypothetical protein NW757_011465 [Fusarium falciforme]
MLSPAKLFIAVMALASVGVAAPEPEKLNNLEARACPGGSYTKCLAKQVGQCQGESAAGRQQCMSIWQAMCQRNC